ncbi:MAG: c-type cytochrome [Planctomycetota bacterium]|jgi:mono/diheme cytochrome c family protein|nr:c-type cytochrome [Planctomycetota bacterium]MDP6762457.1 c-type cytochrome [Planctomycetota bacterium]MDP6989273.1 c-type cytochrome [Planctomycetota bacterium]
MQPQPSRRALLVCLTLTFGAPAASAQAGDRAGEEQPPLPEELVIPPAPALTPGEALASFRVPPGFTVELAAAEPLVCDPITLAFDEDGRMWVCEYQAYMPDIDGTGEREPICSIVVLSDTDGDGRMDRRVVFMDGLVLPRAVQPTRGGALVIVPPDLLFAEDTDGDGRADRTEVIATGMGGIGSPEHAVNGLMPTLDNWVRCANHAWRYRLVRGEWLRQKTAGGGQWGITRDDRGRVFFNGNSDGLRGDLIPSHYTVRNPSHGRGAGGNVRIARDQSVWPARVTPGINRGYQKKMLRDGFLTVFTGACGPLIYRGTAFGAEYAGNAFIAEPCGNLIKRFRVDELPDGRPTAVNVYERDEFMTSTDERFRPVNLANGPDGALYVVDLYRGVIQHRIFVTSFLRDQVLDRGLETPLGLGRIWRIVRDGEAARGERPRLSEASWTELADALAHPDGWWRDTAQRLIVEEGGESFDAHELVRERALEHETTLGRIHALWALEGIGGLDEEVVLAALDAADEELTLTGVRVGEGLLRKGDGRVTRAVEAAGARAKSARLFHQVLCSLGEAETAAADQSLYELLRSAAGTSAARSAVLSGIGGRELDFVRAVLSRDAVPTPPDGLEKFLSLAARCVVVEGRSDRIEGLLDTFVDFPDAPLWQRRARIDGVLAGRPKGPDGKPSVIHVSRRPAALDTLLALGSEPEEGPPAAERAPSLEQVLARRTLEAADAIAWPGREGVAAFEVVPLTEDERALFERGRVIYGEVCAACHQSSGRGEDGKAPRLRQSPFVLGDAGRLTRIVMHGLTGPLVLDGVEWNMDMPAYGADDADIAAVLTYIRREWGHGVAPIHTESVRREREAVGARPEPWTVSELGD